MNAGTDGSGTNYIKHITKYDTDLYAGSKRCVFEPLSVEENIRKEFSRKYMHPLAVLRASIKWTLIKIREDRRCK